MEGKELFVSKLIRQRVKGEYAKTTQKQDRSKIERGILLQGIPVKDFILRPDICPYQAKEELFNGHHLTSSIPRTI